MDQRKRVFVTGGSGMLGGALIRRLVAEGVPVRALVRSRSPLLESLPVERVTGDLTDAGALATAMRGCAFVFHVAGLVSYRAGDAERLYQTNVVGTHNVLGAALEAGIERVVHTSSTAAVGLRDEPAVIDETEPFHPRFRRVPYMWMKHLAEVEVAGAVASGLDVVTVNPSTILGEGDVHRNAGRLFEQLALGRIRFAPPGGNSVVSLDDAVTGHLLALERGKAGRRYILSAENVTNRELLSRISRVLGGVDIRGVLPRWTERGLSLAVAIGSRVARSPLTPAVVFFSYRHRWFSAVRAREELGWTPAVSLEEAAASAARWYRANGVLVASPENLTNHSASRCRKGLRMLGEKIGEGSGQTISQRVLAGHRMEISARGTGKMLGIDTQDTTTYEATMLPNGTLQGEGRSILMGANGEMATSTATGVGTIKPNGDVSWRGAFYFTSNTKVLSRLNGTCTIFEAEIDAKGNSKIAFYEWR